MPLVYFKTRKYLNITGTILSEAQFYIRKYGWFNEVELREGIYHLSGGKEEVKASTIRLTLNKRQWYLGIKHTGYGVWHKRTAEEKDQ